MQTVQQAEFDVIVSGAGLTGLATALALGQAGFQVALLAGEELPRQWPPGSIDARVYAISRASQRLLEQLGAWPDIVPLAQPYRDMRVWDAGSRGAVHFDAAELGEPDLGYIIESRVMARALAGRLEALETVTCLCPARLADFTPAREAPDGQYLRVSLEDGRSLTARLLVGADGKASRVRERAGIPVRVTDYGQQALVATVATEKPHRETAWQRFLPSGPLAFLPLYDGRCSIVWSATRAFAEGLRALDEAAFCHALGEAFEYRLGAITGVGERLLFPLAAQSAVHYVQPRLALVGDAAHVVHPLAGQGVNLGFKDVAELARVLVAARAAGRDPGAFTVLRRYARARRGDNQATLFAMTAFKEGFGAEDAPLCLLRGLGMQLFDRIGPVKRQLVRAAMGL